MYLVKLLSTCWIFSKLTPHQIWYKRSRYGSLRQVSFCILLYELFYKIIFLIFLVSEKFKSGTVHTDDNRMKIIRQPIVVINENVYLMFTICIHLSSMKNIWKLDKFIKRVTSCWKESNIESSLMSKILAIAFILRVAVLLTYHLISLYMVSSQKIDISLLMLFVTRISDALAQIVSDLVGLTSFLWNEFSSKLVHQEIEELNNSIGYSETEKCDAIIHANRTVSRVSKYRERLNELTEWILFVNLARLTSNTCSLLFGLTAGIIRIDMFYKIFDDFSTGFTIINSTEGLRKEVRMLTYLY